MFKRYKKFRINLNQHLIHVIVIPKYQRTLPQNPLKPVQTPIYNPITSSINANITPSRGVDVDEHDGYQEKSSNDGTYLLKKKPVELLENIGSDNSIDSINQTPL